MTKDEALKLALEAWQTSVYGSLSHHKAMLIAMTNMAQALAAPVQEPVVWPIDEDVAKRIAEKQFVSYEVVQLIAREILTTPPAAPVQEENLRLKDCLFQMQEAAKQLAAQRQWVGLTDEEANELWESTDSDWELMKRTESKLRERNT